MRKPWLIFFLFSATCMIFPASGMAIDFSKTSQMAEQLKSLEDQQFQDQDELTARLGSRRILQKHAAAARAQLPGMNQKLASLSAQVDQTRSRLNRATSEYIKLVRQLGQDPNSPAQAEEQQLVQYLSTSRMHDAALVFQLSSQILNQQAGVLTTLRRTAEVVQDEEQTLHQAKLERDEKVFAARGAVSANEARILQLSNAINSRTSEISRIQMSLGRNLALDQKTAGGGILTPGQVQFSYQLAAVTGMDVNVVKAWVLAEMSAGYAVGRQKAGNHNWLNIGYFDKLRGGGAFQKGKGSSVWRDPVGAANASAAFLEGKIFGASSGIRDILLYAGADPMSQIDAIAGSGWASSGYGGGSSLRGTYRLVPHSAQPPRIQVRWRSPRDGRIYILGQGPGL